MAEIFVECIAYGNLHMHMIAKNAEKFKDYVTKNKHLKLVHCYNSCSGAPHYTTTVVAYHMMISNMRVN
jgi:hypothetical protein